MIIDRCPVGDLLLVISHWSSVAGAQNELASIPKLRLTIARVHNSSMRDFPQGQGQLGRIAELDNRRIVNLTETDHLFNGRT